MKWRRNCVLRIKKCKTCIFRLLFSFSERSSRRQEPLTPLFQWNIPNGFVIEKCLYPTYLSCFVENTSRLKMYLFWNQQYVIESLLTCGCWDFTRRACSLVVVGSREQGILFCFLSLRPLLRLVGRTSHRTVCAGRPDTPASDLDTFDITSTGPARFW